MKIRRWAYMLLAAWMLIPMMASADQKPVLILADISGSMQKKIGNDQGQSFRKAEQTREFLLGLSKELSCNTGIYGIRYIAGHQERYERLLKIALYEPGAMRQKIEQEFPTDYPLFNRRTPLADALHQLDEQELNAVNGLITLVLITDAKESFRDPLEELRQIRKKYGSNLTLHTVYLGKIKKDKDNHLEKLLKDMAQTADGKFYRASELLKDNSMMSAFAKELCPQSVAAQAVKLSEPAAVIPKEASPAPVAAAMPAKTDSDGDGVYDDSDDCPDTPKGAKVNHKGCWTLSGVLFDTAKWNIKPQGYPILDEAIVVLKNNPQMKIEVQGHTDSVGSMPYNQKLSEKRADAVKSYFMQKAFRRSAFCKRLRSDQAGGEQFHG
ncbi:MAG: OmpA family protein [Desulfobacteraceae bacterium]|nr:OmpA family protein [Desulfobacteraceae bacterium]